MWPSPAPLAALSISTTLTAVIPIPPSVMWP